MTGLDEFPFLTSPDPITSGEGKLDPLGLSAISERLADEILPGLRARMSRPRFLTAMAVGAVVCDGLEDSLASDGITPVSVVFEWLVVEAFARCASPQAVQRTAGIQKARDAQKASERMSARTYLRAPTVFGFHGIYKPLARQLSVVDVDLRLSEKGRELIREWEKEQGLVGFFPSSIGGEVGRAFRQILRSAVEEAMREGYSSRSSSWKGWQLLSDHLAPSTTGPREADFVRNLHLSEESETRAEIFRLLQKVTWDEGVSESYIVRQYLEPHASDSLRKKLLAIQAFEDLATILEDAFDWIRYLSSSAGAAAISAKTFAVETKTRHLASSLRRTIDKVEKRFVCLPLDLQQRVTELTLAFYDCGDSAGLYEAVLTRHSQVQKMKLPAGKRDWFERGPDGSSFVRVPYRLTQAVKPKVYWGRPYRIDSALSFLNDWGRAS